jgi:hypothetical protein
MSDKADLLSKRSVGHPNLVSGREYYDVSVIMSSLLFGSRRGHEQKGSAPTYSNCGVARHGGHVSRVIVDTP